MSPNEPEWNQLQAMAKLERDSKRFIKIIEQMHRLLEENERKAERETRECSGDSMLYSTRQ